LIAVSALLIWQGIQRPKTPARLIGVIPVIIGILAAIGNGAVAAFLWKARKQNAAIRLATFITLAIFMFPSLQFYRVFWFPLPENLYLTL
jgi:hypothetical protein